MTDQEQPTEPTAESTPEPKETDERGWTQWQDNAEPPNLENAVIALCIDEEGNLVVHNRLPLAHAAQITLFAARELIRDAANEARATQGNPS